MAGEGLHATIVAHRLLELIRIRTFAEQSEEVW
jgi:hypothetical protein